MHALRAPPPPENQNTRGKEEKAVHVLPTRLPTHSLSLPPPPPTHTPPATHAPLPADDPHTKAALLLQAHMGRLPLPITDYVTDTKSVLDNSLRILQVCVLGGVWGGVGN